MLAESGMYATQNRVCVQTVNAHGLGWKSTT